MALFAWAIAAIAGIYLFSIFRALQKNIAAAKSSGMPYFVTPFYFLAVPWLLQSWFWLPRLRKLPKAWTEPWLEFLDNEWVWKAKRRPFDKAGSDVFMVVSPSINTIYVADPEAISQISTRRNDFPKPIEIYKGVDIYGKNVVSTEGSVWRHHRKITSPPFTEKNNQLVWLESLRQAESMMTHWIKPGQDASGTVLDVAEATMRVSLYVISRAGFGVPLSWPHEAGGKGEDLAGRHTMSYKDSLQHLLENLIQTFIFPRWFLRNSPFKSNKIAYESLNEWRSYMQEMYDGKKAALSRGETVDGMDLMGALVKGAGIVADPEKGSTKSSGQLLTDDEILGNAFVFILAGHETAANTLHFAFLFLACQPASQRRLQADLDDIFKSRPVSQWSYDDDVPRLFGSMAGAVMNEELRLVPPVNGIPKCVARDGAPQPLAVGGKRYVCPPDSQLALNTVATHLNPRVWPALVAPGSSRAAIEADLRAFKPERWLLHGHGDNISINGQKPPSSSSNKGPSDDEVNGGDDVGGPQGGDTSASLFKPPRGAYVPFSEGFRACLGRRFAQVEILAVLAVVFRGYSVELAVEAINDATTDDKKADFAWPYKESGSEAREAELADRIRAKTETGAKVEQAEWEAARSRVMDLLETSMGTVITLQLRGARVPFRFVKRGKERFHYG